MLSRAIRFSAALAACACAGSVGLAQAPKPGDVPTSTAAVAKERALWEMIKRKDFRAFDSAVAGMMFSGATGVVPEWKPGLAETFFGPCVLKSYSLDSMQTRTRGNDIVVLAYKATSDWTCGTTKMPSPTYESAVWQRRNSEWHVLYGGSTPAAGK
jgi:uncharacterized protein DUF4440